MQISLDVNTLPVVSACGIYLLTRILQEYRRLTDYDAAVAVALRTTGRAASPSSWRSTWSARCSSCRR